MSDEQKPGDPADRAADGAFGGVQSHRAGYGDDKLARLTEWLRAHPTATLASGEGALLLAENDRLRDDLQKQADWADWAKGEIDRLERILAALRADRNNLSSQLQNRTYDRDGWKRRAERFERILAALREPSGRVFMAMFTSFHGTDRAEPLSWALRAAVAAAEQEVGRE